MCLEKGAEAIDYRRKVQEYAKDTGPVRRGIGLAAFWYNTAVCPISLETSSNRMQLNLDGSVTMQCGETEIGQGADTAYAQMTAEVIGLKSYRDVHVVSCQDTGITPPASAPTPPARPTLRASPYARQGTCSRKRYLEYACEVTRQPIQNMDIVNGNIVRVPDGRVLMSLSELAMTAQYNPVAQPACNRRDPPTPYANAYSFGCTFAEVEVDIPMCRVKLVDMINVHDCGRLINPALAEAQVHGGMSMAIGYGLSEQLLFDPKTGRPLNNNLLDYKLSTFLWITLTFGQISSKTPSLPAPSAQRPSASPPALPRGPRHTQRHI